MNNPNISIELHSISKKFDDFYANKNISFSVSGGEIVSILGENGAGKTTLMRILTGIYKPDEGYLIYNGEKTEELNPIKAQQYKIGMVHQHFLLMNNLSVWENIILGNEPQITLKKEKIVKKILDLEKKYALKVDPYAIVGNLNIGLKQQVELLKLLYKEYEILIFDEPTALLMPDEIESLFNIFKKLKEEGKLVLFITHKLDEIFKISDYVILLSKGEMLGKFNVKEINKEQLIHLLFKDFLIEPSIPRGIRYHSNESQLILKVNCEKKKVIEIKDLTLKGGEIFGLAGVAGNGQKILFDILFGVSKGSKKIILNGKDVTQKFRYQVALIVGDRQNEGLILNYDMGKNYLLNIRNLKENSHYSVLNNKKIGKKIENIIEKMQINVKENIEISHLSGGNQQRFIIGRELLEDKKIIFAQNPTRGLDMGSTLFVHDFLIKERNRGKIIFLVSTELNELLKISDRIGIIFKGRIIAFYKREDFDPIKIGRSMLGIEEEEYV